MKKIISLAAALILALSIAGCSSDPEKAEDEIWVIADFESIDELYQMTYTDFIGEAKCESGQEFVTSGEKCLVLNIDRSSNMNWPNESLDIVAYPKFSVYAPDPGVMDVSRATWFAVDVNVQRPTGLVLQIFNTAGGVIYESGRLVREAGGSTVYFPVNDFDRGSKLEEAAEFRISVCQNEINEGIRCAFDNFRVKLSSESKTSAVVRKIFRPNEILSFSDETDMTYVYSCGGTTVPVTESEYSRFDGAGALRLGVMSVEGTDGKAIVDYGYSVDLQRHGIEICPQLLRLFDFSVMDEVEIELFNASSKSRTITIKIGDDEKHMVEKSFALIPGEWTTVSVGGLDILTGEANLFQILMNTYANFEAFDVFIRNISY